MAALIGLIGFALVPAGIIYFLLGVFKKDSSKKQKALKILALGVVMFIAGFVFHESKPETADKTVAGTKQEVKQEEKQQPKQQQKPEVKEEPKPEVKQEAKQEVKQKKSSGFFSSLFGGSSREATPITDEYLQKFIYWAQSERLQKDELKDALVHLDKLVDLKRVEIDDLEYGKIIVNSLPGESYSKFLVRLLARRNKSGKFAIEEAVIDDNEGYFYLYNIRNGVKEPPIAIEKLFVTQEDRKAFRKVIDQSPVDFKELKFENDYYNVSWLVKLDDDKNFGNTQGSKFFNYVPLIGYAAVFSKEVKYYGGSDKQYLALVQWFKASDRSRYDKTLFYENIKPDDTSFPMQWQGFNHLNPNMAPFKFDN